MVQKLIRPKTNLEQISASKKPLLQITDLSKNYKGEEYIVDGVNLEIYEGEFFSLLGSSGCGKSTLMRMIAGLETPTTGKIVIDGKDMTNVPVYQRPVNMMFQSYALFPHMNIMENVAFGLKQESIEPPEIEKRVIEALEIVKMENFLKRKPKDLSGGQQQRVALARSIVKRPKLLLLDEPLGALDRKTREHTQIELIKIQNFLGITFLMVTHDEEEAMAMSNRMAVMHQGKLLQVGAPEFIYERPNSRYVADFIGPINIFSGFVVSENCPDGFVTIESSETQTRMKVQSDEKMLEGMPALVAVRPEEIEIDSEEAPEDENQIIGTIIDIAFLGNQTIYHVELETSKIVDITVPTSDKAKNPKLKVGEKAYISWYHTDGIALSS